MTPDVVSNLDYWGSLMAAPGNLQDLARLVARYQEALLAL